MTSTTVGKTAFSDQVLLALLVPAIGLVLSCIQLGRGNGSQGALLLLLSVAAGFAWLVLLLPALGV